MDTLRCALAVKLILVAGRSCHHSVRRLAIYRRCHHPHRDCSAPCLHATETVLNVMDLDTFTFVLVATCMTLRSLSGGKAVAIDPSLSLSQNQKGTVASSHSQHLSQLSQSVKPAPEHFPKPGKHRTGTPPSVPPALTHAQPPKSQKEQTRSL